MSNKTSINWSAWATYTLAGLTVAGVAYAARRAYDWAAWRMAAAQASTSYKDNTSTGSASDDGAVTA